ncbi:hypothetical protein OIDMADRAFT_180831 [Oidiodendron maius Zn]|uniref:ABM domain-containing protein n=1 Tax=Oidiodendron maius (strain Zn) TaxID=913774 RepID=A0A0C3CNT2_OIDMZ|nr:hypothetical protein OIDMADRAFT_180831 [Oidiodendron maius Zn]
MANNQNTVQQMAIFTPKKGMVDELLKLAAEGAEHHKHVPTCLKWLFSQEINVQDGDEPSFILVQEWSSVEELFAHRDSEYAINMRNRILPIVSKFEMKTSKYVAGFHSK